MSCEPQSPVPEGGSGGRVVAGRLAVYPGMGVFEGAQIPGGV